MTAWREAGVSTTAMPLTTGEYPGRGEWAELAAKLEEERPDLVQAGPLYLVAEGVRQLWTGPLLATSWGWDLMGMPDARQDLVHSVERSVRSATMLLVDSDPSRAVAEQLGARSERVVQFPWGVDTSRFTPSGPAGVRDQLGLPADTILVLSTRRHEPVYDVDTLLSAFEIVAPRIPRLHMVIAGEGSQTPQLRATIHRAGIGGRVSFVGALAPSALPEFYRSADTYVSCSLTDGTSVSLLEAMASGTPCVVTDIPGNRPWADPGAVDLFAPRDTTELAELLSRITPREGVRAVTDRVRRRILKDADWASTAATFGALAERVVAAHREDV
ncbi:glycosyltransferase [Microbacterium koreense]|uniref:D-inositol 3-phosphate glycosyltransferase n=1 Tax=Microbacterium koreense TaxID=323761 RepID=A0ABW2ZUY0_9MICO